MLFSTAALGFAGNGLKKRKYVASDRRVDKNAMLINGHVRVASSMGKRQKKKGGI